MTTRSEIQSLLDQMSYERARQDLRQLAGQAVRVAQMRADAEALDTLCRRPNDEFATEEDAVRYVLRNRAWSEMWNADRCLRRLAMELVDSGVPAGLWIPIQLSDGTTVRIRILVPGEEDDEEGARVELRVEGTGHGV